MKINKTDIVPTYAEAFAMWGGRAVITADSRRWALTAARSMTGFATSVIGCPCEAAIEREVPAAETPDGRPGFSVLLFTVREKDIKKRLMERIGQCVMTCPTTACFNGLESEHTVSVGGALRYFGDGHQMSKVLNGRRLWRIPVLDGEFLVDDLFGVRETVGGGNLFIMGASSASALRAATAACDAMAAVGDVFLPFPGGTRSGSKVGSRYKGLVASTNDAWCPSLRGAGVETQLPENINAVYEIVINGLTEEAVREAMRAGMLAAAEKGALIISAGNYGGNLGRYKLDLEDILGGAGEDGA